MRNWGVIWILIVLLTQVQQYAEEETAEKCNLPKKEHLSKTIPEYAEDSPHSFGVPDKLKNPKYLQWS